MKTALTYAGDNRLEVSIYAVVLIGLLLSITVTKFHPSAWFTVPAGLTLTVVAGTLAAVQFHQVFTHQSVS